MRIFISSGIGGFIKLSFDYFSRVHKRVERISGVWRHIQQGLTLTIPLSSLLSDSVVCLRERVTRRATSSLQICETVWLSSI